ncbi:hypothetical protein [Clostridium akagii]|uniref:hypothetical protein n=1 Tax=Clostridium akagii TaxID=91623 RepID=UPI00068E23AF|nr:hypothetical protein [Clostridium akagii]
MNGENELKIFAPNDSEWYVSPLGKEDFIIWFIKHLDSSETFEEMLENTEECNLDNDYMWCPTENKEDIEELGDNDEINDINGDGYLRRGREDSKVVEKLISFRQAMKLIEIPKEPYCISTTGY